MKKLKKLVKTSQKTKQKSTKKSSSAFDETRRQWYKNLVAGDDATTSSDSDDDDRIESIKYYFKKDSSLCNSGSNKMLRRSDDLVSVNRPPVNVANNSSSVDNLTSSKHTPRDKSMLVKQTFNETKENTISVLTGQIVQLLDDTHYFWSYVERSDGEKGFVPKTYLALIPNEPEDKTEKNDSENNSASKSPVILPEKNEYMNATNLARVSPFNQNILSDGVKSLELETSDELKKESQIGKIAHENIDKQNNNYTEKEQIATKKQVRFSTKVLEFAEIKDASDFIDSSIGKSDDGSPTYENNYKLKIPESCSNSLENNTFSSNKLENRLADDDYREYLVRKYLRKKVITRRNSFVYNENKYCGDTNDKMYYSDNESSDYYKKRKHYEDKENYYDNGCEDVGGSWC